MLSKSSALGFVAPFLLNGALGAAELPVPPSPTFSENPQVLVSKSNKQTTSLPTLSPTNPTPERPDNIVELSKPTSPFSLTRMPRDLSQVAQGDGQRTVPPLPENYRIGAEEINNLQGEIERTDRELTQGLRNHNQVQNERLQQLLKRTNK